MIEATTLRSKKSSEETSLYIRPSCPSCGQTASLGSIPESQSRPTAESLPFERLKEGWHGFFKEKSFFSYLRCGQCGTLYCRNYFTPEQLGQLYRQMPDNTAGVPIPALQKTQESYFRFLRKYSSLKGDYLELGPDIGLFTEFSVREGHFDRFWLFEPNTLVKPALEKLLIGREYNIFPQFLDLEQLPDHQISVVVMVHVLDHLTDPKSFLLNLKKKLAPGAVLLFITHDESSLLAKLTKTRWPPYCLQHPLLFKPKTLSNLLESTGYKRMSIMKSTNYFPLGYLVRHGLWALGFKKVSVPDLPALTLPFRLGNIATVATLSK